MIIPDGQYGSATQIVREIIERSMRIRWFKHSATNLLGPASDRILKHLRSLSEELPGIPANPNIGLIVGPLTMLTPTIADVHKPWGDRWRTWWFAVGTLSGRMVRDIEHSPETAKRFAPPLWPICGRPSICGTPLVAKEEHLAQAGFDISSAEWKIAWVLLNQAEATLWSAITWEVWTGPTQKPNPFLPLLELYFLDYFPMGYELDTFTLYRFSSTSAAIA